MLVGHHRRYNPLIQEARAVVQGGTLGKLVGVSVLWTLLKPADYYQVEWRCRRPGGGPTLINLIHEFDSLRFICGEIGQVYAQSSSAARGFEVEDSLSVALSFENGALGSILASDATPAPWSYEATTGENPLYFRTDENCCHFFGTLGSLAFPRMELWRYADAAHSGWQHPLERSQRPVAAAPPLLAQLEHFCRVIRGEEEPLIDGRDGARSLAVALAVLESSRRRAPDRALGRTIRGGGTMTGNQVLLGLSRWMLPLPPALWRRQVAANAQPLPRVARLHVAAAPSDSQLRRARAAAGRRPPVARRASRRTWACPGAGQRHSRTTWRSI